MFQKVIVTTSHRIKSTYFILVFLQIIMVDPFIQSAINQSIKNALKWWIILKFKLFLKFLSNNNQIKKIMLSLV